MSVTEREMEENGEDGSRRSVRFRQRAGRFSTSHSLVLFLHRALFRDGTRNQGGLTNGEARAP